MIRAFVFIAALLVTVPAAASSDDAWEEHEETVIAACIEASGFNNATPVTQLIMFDDDVGNDALVIEGEYPQEHMKGQRGSVLCLFNKEKATAAVSEVSLR